MWWPVCLRACVMRVWREMDGRCVSATSRGEGCVCVWSKWIGARAVSCPLQAWVRRRRQRGELVFVASGGRRREKSAAAVKARGMPSSPAVTPPLRTKNTRRDGALTPSLITFDSRFRLFILPHALLFRFNQACETPHRAKRRKTRPPSFSSPPTPFEPSQSDRPRFRLHPGVRWPRAPEYLHLVCSVKQAA